MVLNTLICNQGMLYGLRLTLRNFEKGACGYGKEREKKRKHKMQSYGSLYSLSSQSLMSLLGGFSLIITSLSCLR